MNRPWVIWCISGVIALLVFGAMGVITRHTLGLEKGANQAEAKAELEERIRIALWRMDTYATGILAEENNRPAWHFRDVDMQKSTRLTPLNIDIAANRKLHFEIRNGDVCSPQFNGSIEESLWNANLAPVRQAAELSKNKQDVFQGFKDLIYKDRTFQGWKIGRNLESAYEDNNLGVVNAIASRLSSEEEPIELPDAQQDQPIEIVQEQRSANPNDQVRSIKSYQANYNQSEKAKRNVIVGKSVGNKSSWSNKLLKKQEKKPMVQKGGSRLKSTVVPADKNHFDTRGEVADAVLDSHEDVVEGAYHSPLYPVWIGDELLLVRHVQDGEGKRVQGVWLDAVKLRTELIENIIDLLPEARLERVAQGVKTLLGEEPDPNANDPMVLAALPWRLQPGEVAMASSALWTPMRKTLAVAWVGALLAAFAAIVLLRGVVKLSERRASFVSSVTHELRTPLTTFGLYSDMLAEGMVKDEDKKQTYLNTLRKESARLTHLVENVLAYSRIERGSARARVEEISVGDLVNRMSERLRKRAEESEMELRCELPDGVAGCVLNVDMTAVEQIIFNLVDNASKYASGDGCGSVITLSVQERGRSIVFQIADQGKGIARHERRRLFRAFHKSAQEAAHSKPGVGLGLALCRRLARALGGDLKIVDAQEGACFELVIRRS